MDGLEVQRINEDNRTYFMIRARCIVAEFLASNAPEQELPQRDFALLLVAWSYLL